MGARLSAHKRASTYGLGATRDTDWRHDGSCKNYNPDWWTPTGADADEASWAAYVCLGCPVRRQCSAWAEANTTLCAGGIYAGTYYVKVGKTPQSRIHAGRFQPMPRQPPDVRALLAERFGSVAALEQERIRRRAS